MLHKAVSLWQPPAASCQLWQLPATSCQLQEVACYHMSAYGSSLLPAASLASGSCPCCQLSAIKFWMFLRYVEFVKVAIRFYEWAEQCANSVFIRIIL
jgi:hypothetical protein